MESPGISSQASEPSSVRQRSLNTQVRPGLIRGVPLHVALSGWGQYWRSPDQGMFNVDPKLYQLGRPTKSYDSFLSHDWAASRWLKFLSLLIVYNSGPAFAISCLVSLLVGVLRIYRLIPDETWTVSAVYVAYLVIFLFWQRLRALFCAPRMVFMDKLCVAQHDEELKQEGIEGLAAFLNCSRQLVVLLSPRYLSRLWCVFEISTFLQDRASINKIQIMPLKTALLLLMVASCWHLLASYYFSLIRNQVTGQHWRGAESGLTFTFAMLSFCSVIVPLSFYVGIGLMGELGEVPNQLQSFRVQDAKCYCCSHSHMHPHSGETLPCDRQLVYETFKKWWSADAEEGSEQHLERFNTLVRKHVAPKIARGLGIALPFRYLVYMAVFCIVPWLSDFMALWAEARDHRAVISMWSLRHYLLWGTVGTALPFSLGMSVWLWKLGSRIEKRLNSRWCAVFIVVPFSLFGVSALWLPISVSLAATPEDNPLPVFLFIAAIAITALVWRGPKCQEPLPSKQPSPRVSQEKEDDATFSI